MTRPLEGRPVLVTGAGKGLGRAYALDTAANGAAVVVNDVDGAAADAVAAEIVAGGGRAVADTSDIATPAGAQTAVALTVEAFGGMWGLVNNAGVFYEAHVWNQDLDRVRRLLEVNIFGPMYCTAAACGVLRASGGGAIVNAGSLGAMGEARAAAYAASKGAVTSFSAACAVELESEGIRVNTIWPSAFTPMVEDMMMQSSRPEVSDRDQPAVAHLNRPEEVAPLVSYLLADEADGITGQVFHFNGRTLGVVVHVPLPDSPATTRDQRWSVADVAAALSGPLAGHLQPYGPRGRCVTPRLRFSRPSADTQP